MHVENTSFFKTHEIWNFLETDKSLALSVGVIMVIMCPMIVLGKTMTIIVVWKDPLRNLRSFTSSYILQSLAIADFLVGSILCPLHSYWSLTTAVGNEPLFSVHVPLTINAILISVSVGHALLLTIDRLLALLAPLLYRVKVTHRRVCTVICAIWGYALVLGVSHAALADHFLIFSIIHTAKVLVAVSAVICMNIVILSHFLKDPKRNENSTEAVPIRHFYQREKNLHKAIALIVCTNVVCFIRWLLIETSLYLCMLCRPNLESLMKGLGLSSVLIYIISLLNPLLYSWRLARFRNSLKHLLSISPHRVPREEPEDMEVEEYDTRL